MSLNDPLPPDLTILERQLRGLPLPAEKLNREATLYQCGWAAAEAHFGRMHWRSKRFWISSSGVLAASVVVLAVVLVKQHAPRQLAEQHTPAPSAVSSSAGDDATNEGSRSARPITQASPSPFIDFTVRFAPHDRSLLAVRERALRGVLPEASQTVDQGEAQFREPKTRRELLNEFIERNVQS